MVFPNERQSDFGKTCVDLSSMWCSLNIICPSLKKVWAPLTQTDMNFDKLNIRRLKEKKKSFERVESQAWLWCSETHLKFRPCFRPLTTAWNKCFIYPNKNKWNAIFHWSQRDSLLSVFYLCSVSLSSHFVCAFTLSQHIPQARSADFKQTKVINYDYFCSLQMFRHDLPICVHDSVQLHWMRERFRSNVWIM